MWENGEWRLWGVVIVACWELGGYGISEKILGLQLVERDKMGGGFRRV